MYIVLLFKFGRHLCKGSMLSARKRCYVSYCDVVKIVGLDTYRRSDFYIGGISDIIHLIPKWLF